MKILKATAVHSDDLPVARPGTTTVQDGQLLIGCADGWVRIDELTPPGKGKMSGQAWLNGLQSQLGHFGPQEA